MKCPKCKKGILQKEITYEHGWGDPFFLKIVTWYCPLCDFERKKKLSITKKQYQMGSSECSCESKTSKKSKEKKKK